MSDGWTIKKLGDVCSFDKTQGQWSGLPYVGMEDVESGTGRFLGVTDPVRVRSTTFKFTPNHILYGRLRPYLNKVLLPDFEGHCSTEIFPIKTINGTDRRYLFHWLLWDSTTDKINATCTGARMPRANMNEVLGFEIPVPPVAEQKRIVAILDEAFEAIDKAKQNAEKNLQNARELFESHLQSVFTQRGDGWVEKPLSELCNVKHGFAFKSEFFTASGDHILLTPGNFYESGGYCDRGEKQKYYVGDIPQDFVLSKGDLLVAMTEQAAGLLGSPILVPESGKFLHNQRLGLVQKKPGIAWTNEFFYNIFNLRYVRRDIHASATGVKVRHTSPTKIGEIVVSFPTSISEQKQIVDGLDGLSGQVGRLESVYRRKLAALDELKESLLQRAFSGEI